MWRVFGRILKVSEPGPTLSGAAKVRGVRGTSENEEADRKAWLPETQDRPTFLSTSPAHSASCHLEF